jgi:hypothetical protein
MAIFKVSYVIVGKDHPGLILNQEKMPDKGEAVQLGDEVFEIVEVLELVPQRGEFHYIHVTCRPYEPARKILTGIPD